jgi:hypothetical protein
MQRIYVEGIFEHKGYKCVCVFNAGGFRCGYVSVDNTHPYYGKNYTEDGPDNIMCHWGLTYSGNGSHFCTDNDVSWWFGFDCGHYEDGVDFDTAKNYAIISDKEYLIGKEFSVALNEESSIKTQEFVEENCKMIVEQLIAVKNRSN